MLFRSVVVCLDSQFTSTLSVNFHFPKIPRRTKEKALSSDKAFLGEFGRCERIRTSDPLHPMQMRYLAALHTDGVSSADGEEV